MTIDRFSQFYHSNSEDNQDEDEEEFGFKHFDSRRKKMKSETLQREKSIQMNKYNRREKEERENGEVKEKTTEQWQIKEKEK